MSDAVWSELGIAPFSDSATIRRAYAARLKQTRPEDDPSGFARLRGAYEAALRIADSRAKAAACSQAVAQQTAATGIETRPSPDREPRPENPVDTEQTTIVHAITELQKAIKDGDVERACDLLLTTRGGDLLPIVPWMQLRDLLAMRLAQDAAIEEDLVERVAARLGWTDKRDTPSKPVNAVQLRIDAARWLNAEQRRAGRFSRFLGWERNAAAATLLGSGPLTISWLLAPYAHLRMLLAEAQALGRWADLGLDSKRRATLLRLTANFSAQRHRRMAAAAVAAAAFFFGGHMLLGMVFALIILRCSFDVMRPVLACALTLAGVSYTYLAHGGDPVTAWNIGAVAAVVIGLTALTLSFWRAIRLRGAASMGSVLKGWLRALLGITILVIGGAAAYHQGGNILMGAFVFAFLARTWVFPARRGAFTWRPE